MARPQWVENLATNGDHRVPAPDTRAELLAAVAAAIDGLGGTREMTCQTALFQVRRLRAD